MYPLVSWSYEDLCARLDVLQTHKLYAELVVVGSQLLEQIIKRHLAREINVQRLGWNPGEKERVQLTSVGERNKAISVAMEPDKWKFVWQKLLHEERGHLPIVQAFNRVVGPNAWTILVSRSRTPYPEGGSMGSNQPPLKFGFRQCRHVLVHGTTSPPQREIEVLAGWGAAAVKKVLHPETGWPNLLGWNAQHRLPPFRARK